MGLVVRCWRTIVMLTKIFVATFNTLNTAQWWNILNIADTNRMKPAPIFYMTKKSYLFYSIAFYLSVLYRCIFLNSPNYMFLMVKVRSLWPFCSFSAVGSGYTLNPVMNHPPSIQLCALSLLLTVTHSSPPFHPTQHCNERDYCHSMVASIVCFLLSVPHLEHSHLFFLWSECGCSAPSQ